MKIPLIKPFITGETKDKVCEVLDSGYLTEGSTTRELEQQWKHLIGCGYAVAVTNCTAGLELALRVLKIGPGDEIIVPDFTYPATADVVGIVGAKIIFVDVDPGSMLIDYTALEAAITHRTKAVIPVSLFGNPLDYSRLNALKEKHDLYIIEDAACSIGAKYGDVYVGNLADLSVFSLHPRKFITTGEGGMVTTNRSEWARWIVSYKTFGMEMDNTRSRTMFSMIGSNYKLSNIQAAVGVVQMRHFKALLERRREISERYHTLLANEARIGLPDTIDHGIHSWQSCCVFVDHRDEVIRKLKKRGIETQIGTYALHLQPAFLDNPHCRFEGSMKGSRYAYDHCLTLPVYHDLTHEEQDYVVDALREAVL